MAALSCDPKDDNEVKKICAKLKRYEIALTPRLWPKELSEQWHKSIPDVYLAFSKLREFVDES